MDPTAEHAQNLTAPTPASFRVRWTWLTLGLTTLSVASLTTLAIIVGVKDVDVLSTVALALAVLAFAAQLGVSLAQAHGAASQLAQSERISSETQSALAEIRAHGQALLTNQTELVQKLVAAVLPTATEDAVREISASAQSFQENSTVAPEIDPEDLASRVEEKVIVALREYSSNPLATPMTGRIKRPPNWLLQPMSEVESREAFFLLASLESSDVGLFCSVTANRLLSDRISLNPRTALTFQASSWPAFFRLADLKLYDTTPSDAKIHSSSLSASGYMLARLVFGARADWIRKLSARSGA